MKNLKRPLMNVSPPRPKQYSEFEKLLVKAAGMEQFAWSSITVKLVAGHPPVFVCETFGYIEDLAAAVEVGKKMEVEK